MSSPRDMLSENVFFNPFRVTLRGILHYEVILHQTIMKAKQSQDILIHILEFKKHAYSLSNGILGKSSTV